MQNALRISLFLGLVILAPFAILPSVKALAPSIPITLPFKTGWETANTNYPDPLGTVNSAYSCASQVYSKTSNLNAPSGAAGSDPYLSLVTGFPNSTLATGYGNTGVNVLGAYGNFGGSTSMGVLKLFANDCGDRQVHFKLYPNTWWSVWYYHDGSTPASRYAMIDAQTYDAGSHSYGTIGEFGYFDNNGNLRYIVDQNGVRLNAAYRGSDQVNNWYHALFDLSQVYKQDPGNMYITMIFVKFDNSQSNQLGSTTTYFDDFRITYMYHEAGNYPASGTTGPQIGLLTAEAWSQLPDAASGVTDLWIKVTAAGYTDAVYNTNHLIFPYLFALNAPPHSVLLPAGSYTPPSGVNLTDATGAYDAYQQYLDDHSITMANDIYGLLPGVGTFLGLEDFAKNAYALSTASYPQPSQGLMYQWPSVAYARIGGQNAVPFSADGEVYFFNQVTNANPTSPVISGTVRFDYYTNCCYEHSQLQNVTMPAITLPFTLTPDSDPQPSSSEALTTTSSIYSFSMYPLFDYDTSQSITLTSTSSLSGYILAPVLMQKNPAGIPATITMTPVTTSVPSYPGDTVTVTYDIPPGSRITQTRTYYTVLSASGGGLISQVTIAVTVYADCNRYFCYTSPSR